MRVAIYVRVSKFTTEATLEDQERICREFAERQGWTVVRVYRDAGKSAYKDDLQCRPEFVKLLNGSRSGAIQAVIVFKLDRFARRARIYHSARWELDQAGCALFSATEPNDSSAAGNLSSGMLAQFAEFYSAQLSERIKAAHVGKIKRGEWIGAVPFGYERAGKSLRPGPPALWVVLIFVAYEKGYSSAAIARALNATSVRLRSGKYWTKDSVLMVLHNRAYIGYGHCKSVGAYKSMHASLITQTLWEQAQERLHRRSGGRTARRPVVRAPPLDYRPLCAVCGEPMKRHSSGLGKYKSVYLRCVSSLSGGCPAAGVRFAQVNDQIELLRRAGQEITVVWVKAPRGVERWE